MENWAYIYMLNNEETEQHCEMLELAQPFFQGQLSTGDRASQTTATPQPTKGSSCDSGFHHDFEAAYPSYFFL